MPQKIPEQKAALHPRSRHRGQYDFEKLVVIIPELKNHVFSNKYDTQTIDFANQKAVKILNRALLAYHYGVLNWDIPNGYLCPPIPGRADYVHYVADILASDNAGVVPTGKAIKCLDIGIGANAIYPIIGHQEYGWSFVGADIDPVSTKSANAIVNLNEGLKNEIEVRIQENKNHFFEGIINNGERYDVSFCNPPFYASPEEAQEKNQKKNQNLGIKNLNTPVRNFGGNANELWCEGGELKFIISMIRESVKFADSCKWFTSLVSKKEYLERIYKELDKHKIRAKKTIEMAQGQKISRLVAWSF
jgi:23S rRNA (adenine1618-N6)-methyltransferase